MPAWHRSRSSRWIHAIKRRMRFAPGQLPKICGVLRSPSLLVAQLPNACARLHFSIQRVRLRSSSGEHEMAFLRSRRQASSSPRCCARSNSMTTFVSALSRSTSIFPAPSKEIGNSTFSRKPSLVAGNVCRRRKRKASPALLARSSTGRTGYRLGSGRIGACRHSPQNRCHAGLWS